MTDVWTRWKDLVLFGMYTIEDDHSLMGVVMIRSLGGLVGLIRD